jgi:hypothetical protein
MRIIDASSFMIAGVCVAGGWKDAMFVYKAMKQAGHSMAAPVFDIMTLVRIRWLYLCVWLLI